MMRRVDWQQRLLVYVRETRRIPFQHGVNDCVLWAAGAVDAMTDSERLHEHLGMYSDATGAESYLESLGHENVLDAVRAELGEPTDGAPVPGDVLCVGAGQGWVGVVLGEDAVGPSLCGLRLVPVKALRRMGAKVFRV